MPRLRLASLSLLSTWSLAAGVVGSAYADQPTPPVDEPATPDAPAAPDAGPAVEPAAAPPPVVETGEVARSFGSASEVLAVDLGDRRSYAKDWLVAPPGYTVGGEMHFISAGSSLLGDGGGLHFNDLSILRLTTQITASKRIQLSGAVDVLAKQPDGSEESIAQGGSLGVKVATSRAVALGASAAVGPALGGGLWTEGGVGIQHRSHIEQLLAFQVGASASATTVHHDEMPVAWQADLSGSAELVFHTPRGEWAMWGGMALSLPTVHSDGLDPSTRLDLRIGTIYSAVQDWDLFAEFVIRDRGTTDMPGTVLPIADGGFDQRQIVVGITRRFTERGRSLWALAQ